MIVRGSDCQEIVKYRNGKFYDETPQQLITYKNLRKFKTYKKKLRKFKSADRIPKCKVFRY